MRGIERSEKTVRWTVFERWPKNFARHKPHLFCSLPRKIQERLPLDNSARHSRGMLRQDPSLRSRMTLECKHSLRRRNDRRILRGNHSIKLPSKRNFTQHTCMVNFTFYAGVCFLVRDFFSLSKLLDFGKFIVVIHLTQLVKFVIITIESNVSCARVPCAPTLTEVFGSKTLIHQTARRVGRLWWLVYYWNN